MYVIKGQEKKVGVWLLTVSGSILSLILLGGYTRLTKSGLSMTTWTPLGGMPPKDLQAWNEEFDRYKASPEFKIRNKDMSVEDFKKIYYPEWGHRMLA
jgi:heme a synthase